jgi:N-acetylglucosamine kinase-like BadF-type ATPase
MILIVDSGSTKTDWCVAEHGNQLQRFTTGGINPFFQTEEEIEREIHSVLLPELENKAFEALYFYGAGCLPEKIPVMQNILNQCFSIKTIEVNSDMLAAARSLCGRNPGIACILGTGSNSCYYDGGKIAGQVSPLGFILGDEGSGAVLGKLLVSDILKNQMPSLLKEKFLQQFDLTPAQIIERVYRQPFPNRFLASLSPFLLQNIQAPEVQALVVNSFKTFLRRNVMQYDYRKYPVNFTGSIAYHYREILEKAVRETGMQTGIITQNPLEGLIAYHSF